MNRLGYIGGSDAPVIVMGRCYGKTIADLWAEKTGRREPEDLTDNPDVQRGIALESIAQGVFSKASGLDVIDPQGEIVDPCAEWRRGHIDGRTSDGGILEIKVPRSFNSRRIRDDGVPDHYLIQIQHYLSCDETADHAYLAVFDVDEWATDIYRINRIPELIDEIINRESVFWACVTDDDPPPVEVEPPEIPAIGKTCVREGEIDSDTMRRIAEYTGAWHQQRIAKKQLEDRRAALADAWPRIGDEGAKTIDIEEVRISASLTKSGKLSFRPTIREE